MGGALTAADFQAYNPDDASTVEAGPLALYSVAVDSILPTQMNEGFTEVDAKAAGFDLFSSLSQVEADLIGDIEPVVIGPGGQLYLLDGHHTFTALIDSVWGAQNPTVYVNVVANYSNMTESEFFATMQANNLLLPLNDGVPETVNDATGSPIPTSLTGLTSDPYRGLEYSILKNKDSALFTNANNITGAVGSAKPGLDKMTGFYSDFLEAAAYRSADDGLGLPYLSPGDIALATQWNLTGSNTTTLPNVAGTVNTYQLPGFILSQNIAISSIVSNSTLSGGALDGNGTFTGITEINAGTLANPIMIGTPNVGFVMQLGNDKGFTVTLSNTGNTYTGGTTITAGDLIIAGDGSLGAGPETNSAFTSSITLNAAGVPDNVAAAVQADNGIIFNSLTEGNGTLTIGTSTGGTFTTNRAIAVGSEAATINVNDNTVTLGGQLITLGADGVGIGQTAGFSPLTIDDLSANGGKTATAGTLILSTPSPYFYGDIIIGNVGTPTVEVMSDAALGYDGSNAALVGTVELNGGTLQTGASFSASERNIVLDGGSQIDVDGNTTSWGSLTDIKRTIAIGNSSGTAGSITFNNLTISQTATLQLDGSANGTTYSGAETVTFTNGIVQSIAQDTLLINAAALGTAEKVFYSGASSTLINGIAPVWMISDTGGGASTNPYNFLTYGTNGYVAATYTDTGSGASGGITTATSTSVVDQTTTNSTTLSGNAQAYALKINDGAVITATGHTITLGDGTDPAGLIMGGGSEAFIYAKGTSTISAEITGSNGLVLAGSGTLNVGAVASLSGQITLDSGELNLTAANIFSTDVAGMMLGDVKSSPSNSILNFTANQTFTTLDSIGNKSTITFSGATLTIGDTINNLSSTLSAAITESGSATAGALTFDGSGLFDLSGMSSAALSLIAGSTIIVNNSAELRVTASIFKASTFGIDLNGSNTQLQFAQNGGGQFANAITGTGELHLIGGTLKLTEAAGANTYSGNTVVETGSTLDLTTNQVSTGNANITDAGGLIVFDQDFGGTYAGAISNGEEMGTGPTESGSLDIDDSANTNASNADVTLSGVQDYSGSTYVEAGTLTLGAVNTIADSSGLTLGRVGGAVDGQTANLVLDANNELTSLSNDASNTTSVVLNGNTLTLDPSAGTSSSFSGTISDGPGGAGSVVVATGTVALSGNNSFSGGVTIDNGATFELGSATAAGTGAITFVGDPTMVIEGTTMPTNIIDGFVAGDDIDLASIANVAGSQAVMNNATNVLTITEGSNTYTLNFDPTQNFNGDYFYLASDNGGSGPGTDITEGTTPCYCRGTLIATERGERPVEDLTIGDRVMTKSGQARPIKWIGRRSYSGRFALGRKDILPVCIKAGALDNNVPRRDLWISPLHAMLLDEVLIEAKDLINGVSIVQAERVDKVEYFHIELDSHDVIIAEGALSESFIDDDSRNMFHNAHEFRALYPVAVSGAAHYCAPRHDHGYEVEAVRRRIALRAGLSGEGHEPRVGMLRGKVDRVTARRIEGWAQNTDHPEAPVCLDIYAGGRLLGQVLANTYRSDLEHAGRGSGRHSFVFTPPAGLVFISDAVEVRRSLDGALLSRGDREPVRAAA